jgi:hypothetical protein
MLVGLHVLQSYISFFCNNNNREKNSRVGGGLSEEKNEYVSWA